MEHTNEHEPARDDEIIYEDDVMMEYEVDDLPPPSDDEDLGADDEALDGMDVEGEIPEVELDKADLDVEVHDESVYAIAAHPTQDLMISGAGDDLAKIWRSTDGSLVHLLQGHTDSVVSVCFNFDGTLAATGGYDGIVKIWNVETGQLVKNLEGPSEEIEWVRWHNKGNVVLAGSGDGTAWMWLATTGDCMHVFAGHEASVTCGAFTGTGKMAVTGSADFTVRLWNPRSGECAHVFRGNGFHEGPICTVVTHPSQPICISGSQDGTARILHLQTKKVLAVLSHGTKESKQGTIGSEQESTIHSIESVAFSPVFNWVATACLGGELRIWDLANNQCRHLCKHDSGVTKIAWHPTEPLIVSVSIDGISRVWDARSGECIRTIQAHSDMILDLTTRVSSTGTEASFWTASDDHMIRQFRF